jgi:N-acetylneuraminic acid mutarotase
MFSRISKLFMVCIALVVIGTIHQVEAGTWTQKADMPTARYIAGSAVVDGKIYVIGGKPVSGGATTATAEEYDPATDTWTRRADMPTARQGVVAAAVDGIIYAIGAADVGPKESIVEAYDPAADTWTRKADMPTRRGDAASAVVDGIIYVIGGQSGAQPVIHSTVEAYDPATDTWTKKADMPTARYWAGSCVIDGLICVFGGATKWGPQNAGNLSPVPTVEVYDPATDTWNQASDMSRVRLAHSASVVAGKVYIIGGGDPPLHVTGDIVDVYDPAADTWTTEAERRPADVGLHTADVVDGKIYTIGGCPYGAPPVSTVYEYDPGLPGALSSVSPAGKLLETWGRVKKVQ